jgi:hypothetical protein
LNSVVRNAGFYNIGWFGGAGEDFGRDVAGSCRGVNLM